MGKNIISECGRFEWDSEKDELNFKKHRIHFAEVTDVFDDPAFLVGHDLEHSQNEDRYYGVGCLNEFLIVVIFFTERNGRTRIISARKAGPKMKEAYYDNVKQIDA